MVLNEHLTLPVAAAATYFSFEASGSYLANIAAVVSRFGLDASFVSRAAARRAGRVALGLGAAGFLFSLNEWLNKWCANNWTPTKRGEWDWDREIVVVTGTSVVQKLLDRNPRTTIVVIDFAPLSWTPPAGSKVHYYQADLSDSNVVRNVCEKVRVEVGHPTVFINNAGIVRGFTVMEGSYADVELTIKTNLLAPFILVKEFLPDMVKHNHGHIVSVCSMSSVVAPPGIVDYAATKNGILSLHEMQGLQVELARRHKAPKVRLTNGIFNFIKSPLFKGDTGLPNFLAPLLHVETVSESIVDSLYSGVDQAVLVYRAE